MDLFPGGFGWPIPKRWIQQLRHHPSTCGDGWRSIPRDFSVSKRISRRILQFTRRQPGEHLSYLRKLGMSQISSMLNCEGCDVFFALKVLTTSAFCFQEEPKEMKQLPEPWKDACQENDVTTTLGRNSLNSLHQNQKCSVLCSTEHHEPLAATPNFQTCKIADLFLQSPNRSTVAKHFKCDERLSFCCLQDRLSIVKELGHGTFGRIYQLNVTCGTDHLDHFVSLKYRETWILRCSMV